MRCSFPWVGRGAVTQEVFIDIHIVLYTVFLGILFILNLVCYTNIYYVNSLRNIYDLCYIYYTLYTIYILYILYYIYYIYYI